MVALSEHLERKRQKGEPGRAGSYLDLASFHQRTVELLLGPLCICAGLECYKTKTLRGKQGWGGGGGISVTSCSRRCWSTCTLASRYLRSPFVENDLNIQDFAKLLKMGEKERKG